MDLDLFFSLKFTLNIQISDSNWFSDKQEKEPTVCSICHLWKRWKQHRHKAVLWTEGLAFPHFGRQNLLWLSLQHVHPNCLMQVTELTLSANTERDLETLKLETEYIIQPHLPYQLIPSILVLHCRGFRSWERSVEFYLQSSAQTLQIKSHPFPGAWIVGLICDSRGKVTKFYWPNMKRHLNFQATAKKANAAHRLEVRSWHYQIPILQYPWVMGQKTKLFDVTPAAFMF